MSKHFKIFLQGLVVTAPIIFTVYVCVAFALWLDGVTTAILQKAFALWLDSVTIAQMEEEFPFFPHGLGVIIALAAIYFVGLVSRTWIVRGIIGLGEAILDRIPGVKSLYSAVKNLLQFLSGTDEKTKGVPARLKLMDGKVDMLALITQKQPETFMGEPERGRVAVYLPMSYQIGGFTLFVKPEQVEELEGMTVEDVLKLSMTAGVGSAGAAKGETKAESDTRDQSA